MQCARHRLGARQLPPAELARHVREAAYEYREQLRARGWIAWWWVGATSLAWRRAEPHRMRP
ncbi:hypothetical protein [Streptomyces sp. NPDC020681]|uniref:hypothetical protein n=1 Tax=Streptomyces sp. NPDC020681 TaxID=3365083 RepID=UPI003793356A